MKDPIIPTVEAIEDMQRCIGYWGRRAEKAEAESKRLRAAFIDAARLLTLEQLQQLSEQSAHVLADMGLLTHEQAQDRKP